MNNTVHVTHLSGPRGELVIFVAYRTGRVTRSAGAVRGLPVSREEAQDEIARRLGEGWSVF